MRPSKMTLFIVLIPAVMIFGMWVIDGLFSLHAATDVQQRTFNQDVHFLLPTLLLASGAMSMWRDGQALEKRVEALERTKSAN